MESIFGWLANICRNIIRVTLLRGTVFAVSRLVPARTRRDCEKNQRKNHLPLYSSIVGACFVNDSFYIVTSFAFHLDVSQRSSTSGKNLVEIVYKRSFSLEYRAKCFNSICQGEWKSLIKGVGAIRCRATWP